MNAKEIADLLVDLKVAPATIEGVVQDYENVKTEGSEIDRGAFILKLYKIVKPVLKEILGLGTAALLALAYNDFRNIQLKRKRKEVAAAEYFSLTVWSANIISNALFMLKVPQAQTAGLAFRVISGVASYGAVGPQRQSSSDIDPKLWREREQKIKNHTPLKTDKRDAIEEYYKPAKNLLAKEGGWALYMDVEITQALLKQGYDKKNIMDAIQSISPCVAGVLDKDALFYSNYIMERASGLLVGNLIADITKPIEIDGTRNSLLAVKDLPRNPHSKELFDAYAKEFLDKSRQGWTAGTNHTIAENMLKDGRSPQRVVEALKHSPEPMESAYNFVKELRNNLEMQHSRGVAR